MYLKTLTNEKNKKQKQTQILTFPAGMSLPIHKYIYNNNFLKILRGQDKHLKYNIIQQN